MSDGMSRGEEIKISVIMPVYEVEEYVARAIESIQAQTLKDLEFLIVDDGSPDKSGEICDRYAGTDPRITVIHKENGGAHSARNAAISKAKGKYLYFLDSDDWTEPGMLEDMYNLAEQNRAQMVITGFYIETYYKPDRYMITNYIPDGAIYKTKEEFRENAYKLFDKNMLYPPWNKLFLREYIIDNKLYFPATFWDDFPFNLSVIKDIERVVVIPKQYYHFLRVRTESETTKYVPQMYEKREEEHGWMMKLYQYWGVKDEASREMIARRYIDRLIGCFENLTNPNCMFSVEEKRWRIKKMLESKNTQKCVNVARPKSFYAKLMYLPVRWKSTWLMWVEAKTISNVKRKSTRLFALLKANR